MAVVNEQRALFNELMHEISAELGEPEIALDDGAGTLKNDVFGFLFKRSLDFLLEYRPKVKIVTTTISRGRIELAIPNEYGITSKSDIYAVLPVQMGISFPVAYPRALGLAGIAGLGALSTAATALSSLRSIYQAFGLKPTWNVFYDDVNTKLIIIVHPEVSEEGLIFVKYSHRNDSQLFNKTQTQLAIEPIEREWLRRYITVFVKKFLGRIRSRFGETLPLGPIDVTQDGNTLLAESREEEILLVDDLLSICPPPLPSWG